MAEIQVPPKVMRGCDADHEYGIRNPKPDQLLKIANALGISINIFMDFDIETVSDVLSLLFKLDDQIDMKFDADLLLTLEDGKPRFHLEFPKKKKKPFMRLP